MIYFKIWGFKFLIFSISSIATLQAINIFSVHLLASNIAKNKLESPYTLFFAFTIFQHLQLILWALPCDILMSLCCYFMFILGFDPYYVHILLKAVLIWSIILNTDFIKYVNPTYTPTCIIWWKYSLLLI